MTENDYTIHMLIDDLNANVDSLEHHGIKGMKWGIRRTPEQLGHKVRHVGSRVGKYKVQPIPKKKIETIKKGFKLEIKIGKKLKDDGLNFSTDSYAKRHFSNVHEIDKAIEIATKYAEKYYKAWPKSDQYFKSTDKQQRILGKKADETWTRHYKLCSKLSEKLLGKDFYTTIGDRRTSASADLGQALINYIRSESLKHGKDKVFYDLNRE